MWTPRCMPDGGHEGGTDVLMSSIIVNDNLIDFVVTPGAKPGDPVNLRIAPQSSYLHFSNKVVTGEAKSRLTLEFSDPIARPDGSVEVVVSGSIAAGNEPQAASFPIPSPTLFATAALRDALRAASINVKPKKSAEPIRNFTPYTKFYTGEYRVAEHVSPPLSEDVKITLKVSQNLHAGMGPYYLGLLVAKDAKDPLTAGFKVENAFLTDAKLDLRGASQGDGEGGSWADLFSPDFMCHYLAYWKTRPDFPVFFKGLPILGKDGTLAKIQVDNPAAGHVMAKTGTFGSDDKLNSRLMLNGKGLAGYVMTKSGRTLVFAAYINHTALGRRIRKSLRKLLARLSVRSPAPPMTSLYPRSKLHVGPSPITRICFIPAMLSVFAVAITLTAKTLLLDDSDNSTHIFLNVGDVISIKLTANVQRATVGGCFGPTMPSAGSIPTETEE